MYRSENLTTNQLLKWFASWNKRREIKEVYWKHFNGNSVWYKNWNYPGNECETRRGGRWKFINKTFSMLIFLCNRMMSFQLMIMMLIMIMVIILWSLLNEKWVEQKSLQGKSDKMNISTLSIIRSCFFIFLLGYWYF